MPMNAKIAARAAGLAAALGCGAPLQAHHSGYMYEVTPTWVKGTVVRFERINPHSVVTLEDRSEDGEVRRWIVEGPPRNELDRRGVAADFPQIGDTLQFCAFPYKSAEQLSRRWPGVDFSWRSQAATDGSPPRVAGHVMVTADGTKVFWEPHGLLGECVRGSAEPRQSWLAFLTANARAWCEQRGRSEDWSTAASRDFMAELDAAMGNPCE
jgi:hypothetical protein